MYVILFTWFLIFLSVQISVYYITNIKCLIKLSKTLMGILVDYYYYCYYYYYIVVVVKGIVHPKMKILSSFTHPQVVPNLYEFLCSAEHKGKYSEEHGKQSRSGAPLTSIVLFFLLWKSMVPQNSPCYKLFFKISSFEFGRTKNSNRFGTNLRVSKWWQNFIFGWTIPLSWFLLLNLCYFF